MTTAPLCSTHLSTGPAPGRLRFHRLAASAFFLVLTLGAAHAAAQDPDTGLLTPTEQGKFTYEQNCMICHSDELIRAQRLTPKQWTAEVDKMVSWGAPVESAEIPNLLAFLNQTYPATQPPPRELLRESPRFASLLQPPPIEPLPPAANHEAGKSAYLQLCATCHGPNGEGGAPGGLLIQRPSLASRQDFLQLMRTGRGRMPAYLPAQLPDPTVDDILAHLRSLGKHVPALSPR